MDTAKIIASQRTLILPAPPSCVQRSSTCSTAFVVGTYSLDTTETLEAPAVRSGSLCIVSLPSSSTTDFSVNSYTTSSAILDCSIDVRSNTITVASSTGSLELWTETRNLHDAAAPTLVHQKTVQAFDSSILVLSLNQHPKEGRSSIFAVSLSDGSLAVVDTSKSSFDSVLWQGPAHSLEAWTVRWRLFVDRNESLALAEAAYLDSNALLSGGDDSIFCQTRLPDEVLLTMATSRQSSSHAVISDREESNASRFPQLPAISDRRTHQAGVTAILALSGTVSDPSFTSGFLDNVYVTGSYDDHVRILNIKSTKPRSLADLKLDGGVWRLSLIGGETDPDTAKWYVLASCMFAGCRVLEVSRRNGNEDDWKIRVLARFDEHESMNYASDTLQGPLYRKDRSSEHLLEGMTVVSTSFYDRRFCVWQISGLDG